MKRVDYKCEKGHLFEALLDNLIDIPHTASCPECGARATRIYNAPSIHYKGNGFYTTDTKKKGD